MNRMAIVRLYWWWLCWFCVVAVVVAIIINKLWIDGRKLVLQQSGNIKMQITFDSHLHLSINMKRTSTVTANLHKLHTVEKWRVKFLIIYHTNSSSRCERVCFALFLCTVSAMHTVGRRTRSMYLCALVFVSKHIYLYPYSKLTRHNCHTIDTAINKSDSMSDVLACML